MLRNIRKAIGSFSRHFAEKGTGMHLVPDIYGRSAHKQIDIREDLLFMNAAKRVIDSKTSYLYYDRLFFIYQAIKNISIRGRSPLPTMMEVGVFRGGCSHFIAEISSNLFDKFELISVDTFEGFSDVDLPEGIEGTHYSNKFNDTSYENVREYLSEFQNVTVMKNRIQDAEDDLCSKTFDFIHLDVDIYEPTIYSLNYYSKKLSVGGTIIVDDYSFNPSPGVRKAIHEFLIGKTDLVFFELMTGQCMLIKISDNG